MMLNFAKGWVLAALLGTCLVCRAQAPSGLPHNLRYFMTKAQAMEHLQIMSPYRVESEDSNLIAYSIRDAASSTTNGLFLEFSDRGLVEISSMKTGMSRQMFDLYMTQMLALAAQWKAAGMTTAMENKNNLFYAYKDLKSYASISGSGHLKPSKNGYSVSVSFTELTHFSKTTKGNR